MTSLSIDILKYGQFIFSQPKDSTILARLKNEMGIEKRPETEDILNSIGILTAKYSKKEFEYLMTKGLNLGFDTLTNPYKFELPPPIDNSFSKDKTYSYKQ